MCVLMEVDLSKLSEYEKMTHLAKILEALRYPIIIKCMEIHKTKSGLLCIVMD
jgi:hypothetical protein